MLKPILLLAVLLAACGAGSPDAPAASSPSGSASTSAAEPNRTAVVRLDWTGGLCPDGPCARSAEARQADGTWTATGNDRPDGLSGEVAAQDVAALARWLEGRWTVLTSETFTGTCPTAYDGQELTITLGLYPTGPDAYLADADIRTTSSCTHAWPDGFVDELLRRWEDAGLPA